MNNHTYFIGEDKTGYVLAHTSHMKGNIWMFEGLTIIKVLKTNNYEEANKAFEKYYEKSIKLKK